MKISSLKFHKLKDLLDPKDIQLFRFVIVTISLYWIVYGLIVFLLVPSLLIPVNGLIFILAVHSFIIFGSLFLINHIRHRFLRLSSLLSQNERISIKELSENLSIPPEKIRSAIRELKTKGIISGVIDADKNIYLNFDQWNKVRDFLIEHKKLSSQDLAKHFEILKTEAKSILSEIQDQNLVPGYFIEENREFLTQEWIYNVFSETLEKQGRINLNKMKQRLGLTDASFQQEFNNFVRDENVSGFYYDKKEFVKFEEHAEDTFLEEIKNAGSILLNSLSTTFNLSEDYCKYLITEYRSKGLLKGVFSEDKRIFITLDSLKEQIISEIQQNQQNDSLTHFANDLGLSYEVLYITLMRNFDFESLMEHTGATKDTLENMMHQLLVEKDET